MFLLPGSDTRMGKGEVQSLNSKNGEGRTIR